MLAQFVLLVAQLIWANQGWPYELEYNDFGRVLVHLSTRVTRGGPNPVVVSPKLWYKLLKRAEYDWYKLPK